MPSFLIIIWLYQIIALPLHPLIESDTEESAPLKDILT